MRRHAARVAATIASSLWRSANERQESTTQCWHWHVVATNVAELTTEEEQVLRLIALGHSHPEIATRLSLDVERVLAIRAAATSNIGVSSRAAILRYAETRGWVQRS